MRLGLVQRTGIAALHGQVDGRARVDPPRPRFAVRNGPAHGGCASRQLGAVRGTAGQVGRGHNVDSQLSVCAEHEGGRFRIVGARARAWEGRARTHDGHGACWLERGHAQRHGAVQLAHDDDLAFGQRRELCAQVRLQQRPACRSMRSAEDVECARDRIAGQGCGGTRTESLGCACTCYPAARCAQRCPWAGRRDGA